MFSFSGYFTSGSDWERFVGGGSYLFFFPSSFGGRTVSGLM